MLSDIPAGTPPIYWHGFNLYPNIAAIIVYVIIGFLLFKKKEGDVDLYHKVKIGYGIFSICYAMCRVFFILAIWLGEYYQILTEVGYIWTSVGLEVILVVIENNLVKGTRHFFTVVGAAFIVILVTGILGFYPQDIARQLTSIVSPILIALLVILYLYLAIKGTKSIRTNALLVILAIALIGVGAVLDGEKIVINADIWFNYNVLFLELFYSLPPVLLIAGILIFHKVLK